MDKTYFEIKITFVHILILLVAIVLLGIGLFYMGYRAGHQAAISSPIRQVNSQQKLIKQNSARIDSINEKQIFQSKHSQTKPNSLDTEMAVYKNNSTKSNISQSPTEPNLKTFFAIRVGAFSNPDNANRYANSFRKRGYEVHIINSTSQTNKLLFHVLVGKYPDSEAAKAAKDILEIQEKKKFLLVPYQ